MKRIINGKRYNTETSTPIGVYEFGTSGDSKYLYEKLYQTKKGNYFLEYSGGAFSKYGVSTGPNLIGGSSGLLPLSVSEALDWCEERQMNPEDYEDFFDDLIEDA